MQKVSFVVTAHNDEKEIGKCLDSLENLKGDYQIIIIDDGSTDNTLDICKKTAANDHRFLVISQENQGVSVARNVGINKCTGDWIFFIDGDDYIIPDIIEKEIIPRLDTSCDIVYFMNGRLLGEELIEPKQVKQAPVRLEGQDIQELQCKIINKNHNGIDFSGVAFATPWGKAYRTEFIRGNGIEFLPGIIRKQDVLFNLQASTKVQSVMIIPFVGYIYRQRGGRTYKYNSKLMKSDERLLSTMETILNRIDKEEVRKSYYAFLGEHILTMTRLEFCNSTNPYSYKKRRAMFCDYISKEPICELLQKKKRESCVSFDQAIVLFFVKHRLFILLDIYYRSKLFSKMGLKVLYHCHISK